MPTDEVESGGHMNEVSECRQALQDVEEAILRSQYDAARSVNEKQLKLYFGIGKNGEPPKTFASLRIEKKYSIILDNVWIFEKEEKRTGRVYATGALHFP